MRLFVTGATGMLGSEVVPRLLEHGHEVYALTRTPREPWHPRLHYIPGDITKPIVYRGLARFDAALHMAALTSLRESNEGMLNSANVTGTCNVINFCMYHHIPDLIHTSTLYVCGDARGVFKEEHFSINQGFKNRYEESKHAAEAWVRNHPMLHTTVARSGILVGRHSDGASSFFEGFYRPVRAIIYAHRFVEQKVHLPPREDMEQALHLPRLNIPVRIWGEAESTLGITPVDWAAEQMVAIVHREVGRESRQTPTYHIVPDKQPTMAQITEGVNMGLAVGGWNVGPRTRNPVDLFYNRLIRDYLPYVKEQPLFETSLGQTCPPVDEDFLARCVRYWRTHDAGERGEQPEGLQTARHGAS